MKPGARLVLAALAGIAVGTGVGVYYAREAFDAVQREGVTATLPGGLGRVKIAPPEGSGGGTPTFTLPPRATLAVRKAPDHALVAAAAAVVVVLAIS